MIDIGVNLASTQFDDDRGAVVDRALACGVRHLVATGTSLANSRASAALAAHMPEALSFTAGVHPHQAATWADTDLTHFKALWAQDACVAIGECGLDYFRDIAPRYAQRRVLRCHAEQALAHNKPLFLHCRDAFEDFYLNISAFTREGGRGIVHCFTGGRKELDAFLELGLDIGVTGWVTDVRRGQALRDAVRHIPADRLHLETDAPYLAPRPLVRDAGGTAAARRNEPARLVVVAEEIARLRGESVEQLTARCTQNSITFFGLDRAPWHLD